MRFSATAPLLFSLALCFSCGSTPETSASAGVEPEVMHTVDREAQSAFLPSLVGQWHCQSTWQPRTNIPSKVSEGSVENVMSSDGNHLISMFEGPIMMGASTDGAVSYGYVQDGFVTERTNGKGQSVLECDSWSFDPDANCLEFVYGSLRETITWNDEYMYVTRMYKTDKESGVEFLTMESICTRM